MTPLDLSQVEAVMLLMAQYEVDEFASEHFTLKKSRHVTARKSVELDPALALEKHLAPLPNEPWNSLPQEEVDKWAGEKP
jgi:hypothetical protein